MIKTLIVTGGDLEKIFLKSIYEANEFDYVIASDRGIEVLNNCNIMPNYIIGDFDSANKKVIDKYINNKNTIIQKLNPEKDYTDTHMALKLAIKLKSTDVIILGAIGSRMDHTISNINILKEALESNVKCKIINSNNEILLTNKKIEIELEDKYKYISLIPLTTEVKGITINGFKYPLVGATLKIGESVGVSNEQIEKKAQIDLKEGILIILKTKD